MQTVLVNKNEADFFPGSLFPTGYASIFKFINKYPFNCRLLPIKKRSSVLLL